MLETTTVEVPRLMVFLWDVAVIFCPGVIVTAIALAALIGITSPKRRKDLDDREEG